MLEDPRELEARAWLPLRDPLPPYEDVPRELLDGTLRLPTWLEPLPPRSKLPELERLLAPPRSMLWAWRWPAWDCLAEAESPRAPPPYLLAVALSLYGAPPRCCALCCQLLLPLRLLMLLFRLLLLTKLLLLLMLIVFPPPCHPQPQPQPPDAPMPIAMPTPKPRSAPPA